MSTRHSISTIRVALLGRGAGSRLPRAVLCTKVELFVNKVPDERCAWSAAR